MKEITRIEKIEKIDRISDYINLDEVVETSCLSYDPRQRDYVLNYDINLVKEAAVDCLKTFSSIAMDQMTLDTKIVITVFATDPDTNVEIADDVTFFIKDFFNQVTFEELKIQQDKDN